MHMKWPGNIWETHGVGDSVWSPNVRRKKGENSSGLSLGRPSLGSVCAVRCVVPQIKTLVLL